MAVVTTPLGFLKPDGNEPVRQGDNVIAANAQKSQDLLSKARADIANLLTAAGFPGDPLVMQDAVVAELVGADTETAAAIELLMEPIAAAAVAPISAEVSTKAAKPDDGGRAVGKMELSSAVNSNYTVKTIPAAGGLPAHTIIKVHNGAGHGRVERVTAFDVSTPNVPVGEKLSSFYDRTGATLLFNGSGWWAGLNNLLMGLSIKDGTLVKGWDVGESDLGKEAIVFMRDGTLRMYSSSTSPEQVIADGGWNSFSWGAAVYKDGALTNFRNIWRYSESSGMITGRQLVGDTLDGSLIFITVPGVTGTSGATGQQIVDLTAGLKIKNLYSLDSGGSVQTMQRGRYIVPSSDGAERALADVMAVYATESRKDRASSGWVDIPLTASHEAQSSTSVPQMLIRDGVAYFRGAVKPLAGGTYATGSNLIITPNMPELVGLEPMDATVTAWGQTNSGPIRMWVQGGAVQMYIPAGGAVNYAGLAALSGTVLPSS